MGSWTRTDAVLDAIYRALETFEREDHRVAETRRALRVRTTRVRRTERGDWIRAPRRTALARYLTDAALTAIRDYDSPDEPEPPA